MPRNQAISAIIAAETRGALWERRVLGYPVWAMTRLQRYVDALFQDGPPAAARSVAERLDALRIPMQRSLAGLPDLRSASRDRNIWVLSLSAYRRTDEHGDSRCIFAEHLRRQLGQRLLFLERNNSALALEHTPPDTIYLDAFHLPAMLSAKAVAPLLARTLDPELREAFAPTPPALLCQLALYGRATQLLAQQWLQRARPEAVFVVCGYQPFIPFQRAVRAAGIPLIELQHGVIHDSHPGYIFDASGEQPHFPDHLVTFGRHFGELLDRESPRWRDRWSVGGHPWLKRHVEHARSAGQERRLCLVFSQNEPAVREQLRALLPELRALLPGWMTLTIKPHPRETDHGEFWAPALAHGIELARHTDDTYSLLGRCRLALSVFSTVAIEAPAFGCPSVVLESPYWNEDIRQLVAQGTLIAARTATEVVAALEHQAPSDGMHDDLAASLFGIGEPELDFAALIERLRRTAGTREA
jgi:hypothetical protein